MSKSARVGGPPWGAGGWGRGSGGSGDPRRRVRGRGARAGILASQAADVGPGPPCPRREWTRPEADAGSGGGGDRVRGRQGAARGLSAPEWRPSAVAGGLRGGCGGGGSGGREILRKGEGRAPERLLRRAVVAQRGRTGPRRGPSSLKALGLENVTRTRSGGAGVPRWTDAHWSPP